MAKPSSRTLTSSTPPTTIEAGTGRTGYCDLPVATDRPAAPEMAEIVAETAIALSYNGISQAVMMATPVSLEDFAVGFSLSQGIVDHLDDIHAIDIAHQANGVELALSVSSQALWRLKSRRRQLAGTSGCGICGVEALTQAMPEQPPLAPAPLPAAQRLQNLRERMVDAQTLGQRCGALHGALFIDHQDQVVACREDIGRHNALDKLIGALARQRQATRDGITVVTSRCSQELVQKAVHAGLTTLVSFAAPSTLAVDWARRHNLTLIHLSREGIPRLYSDGSRPGDSQP